METIIEPFDFKIGAPIKLKLVQTVYCVVTATTALVSLLVVTLVVFYKPPKLYLNLTLDEYWFNFMYSLVILAMTINDLCCKVPLTDPKQVVQQTALMTFRSHVVIITDLILFNYYFFVDNCIKSLMIGKWFCFHSKYSLPDCFDRFSAMHLHTLRCHLDSNRIFLLFCEIYSRNVGLLKMKKNTTKKMRGDCSEQVSNVGGISITIH